MMPTPAPTGSNVAATTVVESMTPASYSTFVNQAGVISAAVFGIMSRSSRFTSRAAHDGWRTIDRRDII
jgi:hypothetical protein